MASPPRSLLSILLLPVPLLVAASCDSGDRAEDLQRSPAASLERIVRQGPQLLDPREHGVGRRVPALAFTDVDGQDGNLLPPDGAAARVILLTDGACPLAKRYAPTLASLSAEYQARGVSFLFLDPNPLESAADLAGLREKHGFAGSCASDPKGALVRALGAKTTTDAFVLDRAGTLVYRGAVDDRYGFGYARPEAQHRYLRDALEAVLDGRRPPIQATWAPGCVLDLSTAPPPPEDAVDWYGRVSRIVQRQCQDCHHRGGIAPFPLETLEQVRARRGMVRFVVERRIMPPWFAAPDSGPWANDRSLSVADRRDLLAWLASDLPAGDPTSAPLPVSYPDGWTIREPDEVLDIASVDVPADGVMPYVNVKIPTRFAEERWIQALEIRPSARDVLHHVSVFLVQQGARLDRRNDFIMGYVPGASARVYRPDVARRLPPGATFLFRLHYTPNGSAVTDRPRLGLVFRDAPPPREVRCVGIVNRRFRIPAGARRHEAVARYPLPGAAEVLSFMPHMHLRGTAFRMEAVPPGGEPVLLLDVPHFDFNWQLNYVLREPVLLPAGTELRAVGVWDNSPENPANPDASVEVRWGPRTEDEMLIGYVEYLPADRGGAR